ncbi:MAG: hypothetical protein MMC33_010187 [Icmadophila ericetorum]|nr:hypothetical protein [Icmadophila ericetorum]
MTTESRARIDDSHAAKCLNDEPDEPAPKRAKRGKYVDNACPQFKRRKIKCPGGIPCAQCVAKRRDCTRRNGQPEASSRGTRHTTSASAALAPSVSPDQRIDTQELLSRLMSVEWRLNSVLSREQAVTTHAYKTPDRSTDVAITDEMSPTKVLPDTVSLLSRDQSPASNSAPLTPKPHSTLNADAENNSRLWLRTILLSLGIVHEKTQWLKYLELYFGELHILFPFLHPPTVWDTFDYLLQNSLFVSSNEVSDGSKETKVSLAVLFLCLAIGRCAGSSRVDEADGKHSAGWSLYSVAMCLLREDLDLTQDPPSSPVNTQALTLMVVYLFGLGANQKAEKTLAQAISSAHILGLHRQITYRNMPLFEKEMFRRLWWSIYVLDRRISLETGRPFLIQDINTNTERPTNLTDDWLQQLKLSAAMLEDGMTEREAELAKAIPSNIPHLNAMISYSKIVGDIWNVVYCDNSISLGSRNVVDVYLEPLLEQARKTMPPNLCYQPSRSFEEQFSGISWSQIKQSLLMYLRYTFLKLMIRKPPSAAVDGKYLRSHDTLANDAVCCELASTVAALFDAIPNQYPKVSFPFINYLTNATMIMFSIVNKNSDLKQAYQHAVISAVRTLMVACRKTWVSGRLIRTISTLDKLTRSMFGPISDLPLSSTASGKSIQSGCGAVAQSHWTESQQVLPSLQRGTVATASRESLPIGTSMPLCPPHHQQQQQPPQQPPQRHQRHSTVPVEHQTFNHAPAMYTSSTPAHFSWNSAAVLISPAHSGSTSTGHQPRLPLQPQPQEYQHQHAQLEPELSTDVSFFGSTNEQERPFADLPTWAMADFDFEQVISANNNDATASFGFWELPDPDPNMLQL